MKKIITLVLTLVVSLGVFVSTNAKTVISYNAVNYDINPGKIVLETINKQLYGVVGTYPDISFNDANCIRNDFFRGLIEIDVADLQNLKLTNCYVRKIGSGADGLQCVDNDKTSLFNKDNNIDIDHFFVIGDSLNQRFETKEQTEAPNEKIQVLHPVVVGKDVFEAQQINEKLYEASEYIYDRIKTYLHNRPDVGSMNPTVLVLDVVEKNCNAKQFRVAFNGVMVYKDKSRKFVNKAFTFLFMYDRAKMSYSIKEPKIIGN